MTGGFRQTRSPNSPASDRAYPSYRSRRCRSAVRGEGMRDLVALLEHLARARLACDSALQRELRRLVVIVLDLGVVARFPVDEHADADEDVVGFIGRNGAVLHAIRHRR